MKIFIVVISIVTAFTSFSQDVQFKCTDSLIGKYDRFSVDNFGTIHVVNNDVIQIISTSLDTVFTASLKSIIPYSIESSKSFRTLLFDKDRSVIKFLDNTLTDIQGEIDLVNQDIQQPILVCESFGGNTIWILDAANLRLIKMNQNLQKVLIIENLIYLFDWIKMPSQMKESKDFLFILIPGKGVARFDVFGTFIDIYPCDADWIDATGNFLFVKTTANKIQVIPLEGLLEAEFEYNIPDNTIDFAFTRQNVYLHTDKGIFIGSFEKTK